MPPTYPFAYKAVINDLVVPDKVFTIESGTKYISRHSRKGVLRECQLCVFTTPTGARFFRYLTQSEFEECARRYQAGEIQTIVQPFRRIFMECDA